MSEEEDGVFQKVGFVTVWVGVIIAMAFAGLGFAVCLDWFVRRLMG